MCLVLFDEEEKQTIAFAFCENFGSTLAESGNLENAEWMFNAALLIYGAKGKPADVARINFNLGNVYRYLNGR